MEDGNDKKRNDKDLKILVIIAAVLAALYILWRIVLAMLPTIGGSFGYGFPSGSGGRAIRDVEIEVEPQVVYRIDDHRFFTFEKYVSCTSGGFVYYNDTDKKIKIFAGPEGQDKKPQDEVTISQQNDVLSFNGKFIYAASDDVIAYPGRNVSYKYGSSNYFIVYENINDPTKNTGVKLPSASSTVIVSDKNIKIKSSALSKLYESYKIPKKTDNFDYVDASKVRMDMLSQDDHFTCNNDIKPKRVKFISN